jgi:integrase
MTEPNDVQSSLDRMKIHMELRGLRPNTVSTFTRCARRFLAHTDKAPAEVTSTDVESFLLDLVRKGRSPRTRNVNLAAVRCLLGATTGGNATAGIPRAKVPRRSPEILSGSEVALLLAATDSPKYRAIFMLAYGAGLRVSEITALQVADIDSKRMLIHVREGKTGPRHVMLSPRVLEALRAYWKDRAPPRDAEPARSRGAARLLEGGAAKGTIAIPRPVAIGKSMPFPRGRQPCSSWGRAQGRHP